MASSNRHWPSMFRSKPASCNQQPWQPDMGNSPPSLLSGSTTKSPFSSGCEERSPEPKPRWNPRPEQIRILEAIFNSGMVNPPRDEIRRIRLQLQEYGQVGDANVFYWFQNRKSRTKNKHRAAAAAANSRAALAPSCAAPATPPPPPALVAPVAPTSSSSSSSDRSSGSSKPVKPPAPALPLPAAVDLLSPLQAPAALAAACQMYYQGHPVAPAPEFEAEPLVLQWPQGHCLSAAELAGILGTQYAQTPMPAPGVFLGLCNEVADHDVGHGGCAKGLGQYWPGTGAAFLGKSGAAKSTVTREVQEEAKLGLLHYGLGVTAADATSVSATLPLAASVDASVTVATLTSTTTAAGATSLAPTSVLDTSSVTNEQFQELADIGAIGAAAAPTGTVAAARGAVVCTTTTQYNVPAIHLNVKLFGEAAVLFRHNGEPVVVDESGVTVEPLQQGAVYYVLVD